VLQRRTDLLQNVSRPAFHTTRYSFIRMHRRNELLTISVIPLSQHKIKIRLTVNYFKVRQVHPSSSMDVYPHNAHIPILRPHAARFHERRISSMTWPARWPIRRDFGLLGSNVHKNVRFPALDADKPPCKIRRR